MTVGAARPHHDEAQVLAFMHEIQRRVHDRRRSPVVRSAEDHGTEGRSTSCSASKVPETRGARAPMLPLRTTNRRFNGVDDLGRGNSLRGHDASPLTEKKARGYREQVESAEARNARLAAMRRRCQQLEGELLASSHNDGCDRTGQVATARELSMGHSLSRDLEDASWNPEISQKKASCIASYDRCRSPEASSACPDVSASSLQRHQSVSQVGRGVMSDGRHEDANDLSLSLWTQEARGVQAAQHKPRRPSFEADSTLTHAWEALAPGFVRRRLVRCASLVLRYWWLLARAPDGETEDSRRAPAAASLALEDAADDCDWGHTRAGGVDSPPQHRRGHFVLADCMRGQQHEETHAEPPVGLSVSACSLVDEAAWSRASPSPSSDVRSPRKEEGQLLVLETGTHSTVLTGGIGAPLDVRQRDASTPNPLIARLKHRAREQTAQTKTPPAQASPPEAPPSSSHARASQTDADWECQRQRQQDLERQVELARARAVELEGLVRLLWSELLVIEDARRAAAAVMAPDHPQQDPDTRVNAREKSAAKDSTPSSLSCALSRLLGTGRSI